MDVSYPVKYLHERSGQSVTDLVYSQFLFAISRDKLCHIHLLFALQLLVLSHPELVIKDQTSPGDTAA